MKRFPKYLLPAIAALGMASGQVAAQVITFSESSLVYTQNFNAMGTSAGLVPTPSGWFVGGLGAATNGTVTRTNVVTANGSGTTTVGTNCNYGVTGNPDRALGSIGTTAQGNNRATDAAFFNNTGLAITNLSISYRGEQWRTNNNTSTQSLLMYFSTDGTNFTFMGGTFTFTSPRTHSGAVGGAMDGNAAGNFANISGNYATNLPSGTDFYLRWFDLDDPGSDHALAIDDVVVGVSTMAIPEPSLIALLGGGILGIDLVRRRRVQAR